MARWQLVGLALLMTAGYCLQDYCVGGEKKPGLLNLAQPDTWEAAVVRTEQQRTEIAEALISVAKDEKRHLDARRKAIFLLGRIGNKESLDFLASNVALHVSAGAATSRMEDFPCWQALSKKDWSVVSAILRSLNRKRSDRELVYLAEAPKMIFGTRMARAAVDHELSRIKRLSGKSVAFRKKNLARLKDLLK